ncbi:hypothetical protein M426DRAFT_8366 [Hypoxylon sp. CI-4A]|nr:hypothetical protein M426DRAFT_8366 [Hypoxylon sp. CI-4A]
MENMQDSSSDGTGRSNGNHSSISEARIQNSHPQRTRVLLSCAPCRSSKLKCDRATPCGHCLRKGKPDSCLYSPRPEKHRPPKSMAARLKRLEGMVRRMIETDGSVSRNSLEKDAAHEVPTGGLVVQGERAQSYVGGTHAMAMLEDIEDLKSYFEDTYEEGDEIHDPYENTGPSELLMFSRGVPKNKQELLAILPERAIASRLMNRYFNSNSPSQHIVHVPTFLKEYNEFCKNPDETPLHWIAMLFMVLALGVFFSSFSAPHELEGDSPLLPGDRFKRYRGAAGWALIWGKYSQPGPYTLQAFMLYVEGEFVTCRMNRMNCFLLLSVLVRLMLKMGLHRDPSKLPNITPYDGEMRRRAWNLAIQMDLLVAFNLGLPSMAHAIESDTELPTNLMDTDFAEDTKELPPARPNTDYTPLTYPINKARITRSFYLVVKQAHALTVPSYTEVMMVDAKIEEAWRSVPEMMRVRPMEECIMDPPIVVIQRFGLSALYQKARCVHHRRYLAEDTPNKEHDYSRRVCLDAALTLLHYQATMHEACRPGGILSQTGWFVAALTAINDFLMANMVVALVLQNDKFWEAGGDLNWIEHYKPTLTRNKLLEILERSHRIWLDMAIEAPELRKSEEVVRVLICRVRAQLNIGTKDPEISSVGTNGNGKIPSMANLKINGGDASTASTTASTASTNDEFMADNPADVGPLRPDLMTSYNSNDLIESEPPWMMQGSYNWSYVDTLNAHNDTSSIQPTVQIPQDAWLDEKTMEDLSSLLAPNSGNMAS